MKATYPIIELERFKKTGSGWDNQAFAIYFVIAPTGNHIIKGMSDAVRDYVKEHFPKCLYRYTYWKNGLSRGGWHSSGQVYIKQISEYDIINPRHQNHRYTRKDIGKHEILIFTDDKPTVLLVRRVPHKWLPVYDQALTLAEIKAKQKANREAEQRQMLLDRYPSKSNNTFLPAGTKKDKNGVRII